MPQPKRVIRKADDTQVIQPINSPQVETVVPQVTQPVTTKIQPKYRYKRSQPTPKNKESQSQVKETQDSKSPSNVLGPKREGGKTALMSENAQIAAMQEAGMETTNPREALMKKFREEEYGVENEEAEQETKTEDTKTEDETEASQEVGEGVDEIEEPEIAPDDFQARIDSLEKQLKNTQNKMHDSTTEASNSRKFTDELAPYVNWEAYQKAVKGDKAVATETREQIEPPSVDLMVTDFPKYTQQFAKYLLSIPEFRKEISTTIGPEITQSVSSTTEWQRLTNQFRVDFHNLPGGPREWEPMVDGLITKAKQKDVSKSPSEIYNVAIVDFKKLIGDEPTKTEKDEPKTIKSQRKILPLESPSKSKEKTGPAGKEKPVDYDAHAPVDHRNYMKYRNTRLSKMRGEYVPET